MLMLITTLVFATVILASLLIDVGRPVSVTTRYILLSARLSLLLAYLLTIGYR